MTRSRSFPPFPGRGPEKLAGVASASPEGDAGDLTIRLVIGEGFLFGSFRAAVRRRLRRISRANRVRFYCAALLAGQGFLVAWELETSRLQSFALSQLASRLTFSVERGPSPSIDYPSSGPYDQRLGYVRLPEFVRSAARHGYEIERQARSSAALLAMTRATLYPVYAEKTQAGLRVLSDPDEPLFEALYPEEVFTDLDSVPEILVRALLFVENRELLREHRLYRNPAVEWDRFALAMVEQGRRAFGSAPHGPGGSTLAVQLEKFRHSPEGRTASADEKLRQMATASLRAYLDGAETLPRQRQILLDYLNSVPLAGIQGLGEVHGLASGLRAWYGANGEEVVQRLKAMDPAGPISQKQALAFKQSLSLFLAQRRPSFYLASDPEALEPLTRSYLRLLEREGIISRALRDKALPLPLRVRSEGAPPTRRKRFVETKGADGIRTELLRLLGLSSFYQLDRLDLTVRTSIDAPVQRLASAYLDSLRKPSRVRDAGLQGHRLLNPANDPSKVIYSFTLYERGADANWLRVETDNFDRPFNLNQGSMLELGSTAKLRTLIHYLEIVAELHARHEGRSEGELQSRVRSDRDPLTVWAAEYLLQHPGAALSGMLEAAMEHRYSASPSEGFFTGGGLHHFSNFSAEDDGKILSVRTAFQHSVNLVFVRLMRDIVRYQMHETMPSWPDILENPRDPRRDAYLSRFANREAIRFLRGFHQKYRGKSGDEALELLAKGVSSTHRGLASVFRSVRPSDMEEELASFLRGRLPATVSLDDLRRLYETHDPKRMPLEDRAFTAGVHPLELWLVGYLQERPEASFGEVLAKSPQERRHTYDWLFRTHSKPSQDLRIRGLIEEDAFQRIHAAWRRLGYPFASLVPSYATALGSSGDRPSALAELVGILVNGGIRKPGLRVRSLEFASDTPYETVLRPSGEARQQVLAPEIARVVLSTLVDVVERGTAIRARSSVLAPDGSPVVVGGKTGTGDNRVSVYDSNGALVDSRVLNRTATFVFFIEDRYFGVVTAFVSGKDAARYGFTSSLPVQLFENLVPKLGLDVRAY